MELTLKDRLYIPAILPKEGNFKEFNHKKEVLRKIEISEQERTEAEMKENKEPVRIEWNIEKDVPMSVEFSGDEVAYLKKACEKLSDELLPDDMWLVVEKIYDAAQAQ